MTNWEGIAKFLNVPEERVREQPLPDDPSALWDALDYAYESLPAPSSPAAPLPTARVRPRRWWRRLW